MVDGETHVYIFTSIHRISSTIDVDIPLELIIISAIVTDYIIIQTHALHAIHCIICIAERVVRLVAEENSSICRCCGLLEEECVGTKVVEVEPVVFGEEDRGACRCHLGDHQLVVSVEIDLVLFHDGLEGLDASVLVLCGTVQGAGGGGEWDRQSVVTEGHGVAVTSIAGEIAESVLGGALGKNRIDGGGGEGGIDGNTGNTDSGGGVVNLKVRLDRAGVHDHQTNAKTNVVGLGTLVGIHLLVGQDGGVVLGVAESTMDQVFQVVTLVVAETDSLSGCGSGDGGEIGVGHSSRVHTEGSVDVDGHDVGRVVVADGPVSPGSIGNVGAGILRSSTTHGDITESFEENLSVSDAKVSLAREGGVGRSVGEGKEGTLSIRAGGGWIGNGTDPRNQGEVGAKVESPERGDVVLRGLVVVERVVFSPILHGLSQHYGNRGGRRGGPYGGNRGKQLRISLRFETIGNKLDKRFPLLKNE